VDWQYERYRLDVLVGPDDFDVSFGENGDGSPIMLDQYLAGGKSRFSSKKKWYAGFWDNDDGLVTLIPTKMARKWAVAE